MNVVYHFLVFATEKERDRDAIPIAAKASIIVGASLVLWTLILWGVGIL